MCVFLKKGEWIFCSENKDIGGRHSSVIERRNLRQLEGYDL